MDETEARELGKLVAEVLAEERRARNSMGDGLSLELGRLTDAVAELRREVDAVATALAMQPSEVNRFAAECRDAVQGVVTRAAADTNAYSEVVDAAVAAMEARMDAAMVQMQSDHTERWASAMGSLLAALAAIKPGEKGDPGDPGQPGEAGRDGSLAQVRPYQVGEIYRAGDVVALPPGHASGWALAKALADTYEIPGDDETPWVGVVSHGQNGRGMRYRGIHHPSNTYDVNDVVTHEGATWVRVKDAENQTLPGEGWAVMIRAPMPGEKGDQGDPGYPGRDGVGIDHITAEGHDLVFTLSDSSLWRVALPVIYLEGTP